MIFFWPTIIFVHALQDGETVIYLFFFKFEIVVQDDTFFLFLYSLVLYACILANRVLAYVQQA